MSAVATRPLYTPEDLLALPDETNYELVGGELVERNVSALSSWVGLEVAGALRDHLKEHPVGQLFASDLGYRCFADDPRKVRRADVSFITTERLPADWQQAGFLRVVPDLAVEVISPNDLATELNAKVAEYLGAGVRLVWVIDPEVRVAYAYRYDFTSAYLRENDELDGEGVLPGFRCRIASLFPPPAAAR